LDDQRFFCAICHFGIHRPVFLRGDQRALVLRGLSPGSAATKSHVYPIYSNHGLIKLVDFQRIISAILLFQYHHLVSKIVFRAEAYGSQKQEGADHLMRIWQCDSALVTAALESAPSAS